MVDGLPRNHALVAIAQRWVQKSPAEAREWLDRLDPAPAVIDACHEIAVIEEHFARSIDTE